MTAQTVPTRAMLRTWYRQWLAGRSKSAIEREEMDNPYSHGKAITKLWREVLGYETEETHPLAVEVQRLRDLCIKHGIDPDIGAGDGGAV